MKSNKKRLATMSLGAMMLASGLTGCKEKTNTVDLTEDITTEITTENVLTTEAVDNTFSVVISYKTRCLNFGFIAYRKL